MSTTSFPARSDIKTRPELRAWLQTKTFRRLALASIIMLAAALRFSNLAALGYVNHYYTAGTASMLQSWHNFFFVAAEPGGAVSIDKPPVGLWLQAISAYFFGLNGFAVVLPQLLAGMTSVVVLYHLVRRSFGTPSGLLAALALTVTPVVIATDRNNTIDSTLILTLLLATWAFLKATETSKLRFLLLGAVLVGIGFNIKMLQAFLPLPAFYTLYLLGAKAGIWRKLAHLGLATVLVVVVSLSWAVTVDLTPASQRPYVGSSGNNSVINLMLGYNGVERLVGMGGNGGIFGGNGGQHTRSLGGRGDGRAPRGQPPPPRAWQGHALPFGLSDSFPGNGFMSDGQRPPSGGFGSGFDTGQAGPLRLLSVPLSNEVSWLLPFGLFAIGLLLFRTRLRWPIEQEHQAGVVWGGWLLTGAAFFSIAGFFHPYYLSMLAAPLAALVAIGTISLWQLHAEKRWLAMGLLLLTGGITLGFQVATAHVFVGMAWWLAISIALFVSGAAIVLVATRRKQRTLALTGFATVMLALLVTPGIWSGLTMLNASENQSLPSAYLGRSTVPINHGELQINQTLLDYLQTNTQNITYLMAVPSSMQGADYVLATKRPVLYLGGFMGQDKVESSADLARMVEHNELRYIYWDANSRGGFNAAGRQASISDWVSSACQPVNGFETLTRNSGAPDGTARPANRGPFAIGELTMTLYDCKRKA